MERAASPTVPALHAGISLDLQIAVMLCRHEVPISGNVIVFIDDADIQPFGARLTVITVLQLVFWIEYN